MANLPMKTRVHYAMREAAIATVGSRLLQTVGPDGHLAHLPLIRRVFGIQLNEAEIHVIASSLSALSNRRLLVFGLGNDSVLWNRLNRDGTTVFVEDDEFWIGVATRRNSEIDVRHVTYTTRLDEWREIIGRDERLRLELPEDVADSRWDMVLVDAPRGYRQHHPGRMQSIRAAATLVANGGSVFVHDCHREVERSYAKYYFGHPDLVVGALFGYSRVQVDRT